MKRNLYEKIKRKIAIITSASIMLQIAFLGVSVNVAQAISETVVISEVQVGGTLANDEFVELYNKTGNPIDLSALPLKLHIISSTGNDDNRNLTFINTVIPANGFFLIAPNNAFGVSVGADATYTDSGNMLVDDGSAYISNSITNGLGIIDLVGFGTAGSFEGTVLANLSASESVERKSNALNSLGNGLDTDNNANDFVLRSTPEPQNTSSPIEDIIAPDAPVITLLDPITMANQTAVTITGTGEAGAVVNYSVSDGTSTVSGPSVVVDGSGNISVNGIDVSALDDGTLTVSVTLTDVAGNTGNAGTGDALKDATAPVVSVNSLLTKDQTPDLTGTIDDLSATIVVTVNGNPYNATNNGNGTWSVTVTDTLVEIIYDVFATATDVLGNVGNDSSTNELTIDLTGPSATLSGTPSDPTNQTNINITVGGTDVVAYKYSLDGGAYSAETLIATPITEGGLVQNAKNTLSVLGKDSAGNWQPDLDNTSFSWFIDTLAPIISEDAPISLLSNDDTPGYSFSTDEEGTIAYGGDCASVTSSAGAGANTITYNSLIDGLHDNCTVTVTDAAGNLSNVLFVTAFTTDITLPTVYAGADASKNAQFTTSASASDVSGLFSTVWSVISGPSIIIFGDVNSLNTTVEGDLGEGEYVIRLTVTDNAGNVRSDDFTLDWDLTPPGVIISSTSLNPTNTSPFSVTAEFSENVTGFAVGDVVVGNGSAGNLVPVDGNTYTFDITPAGQGAVTVDVAGNAAQDAAGNNSTIATQLSTVYDTVFPKFTVKVEPGTANTGTKKVKITVTPSEELKLQSAITVLDEQVYALGTTYGIRVVVNEGNTPVTYLVPQDTNGNYVFEHEITTKAEKDVVLNISGTDLAGNEALQNSKFRLDNISPAQVTDLKAIVTDGKVTLTWVNPTNIDFNGVRVVRDGKELNAELLKGTSYVDADVLQGVSYSYDVYAVDTAGNKGEKVNVQASLVSSEAVATETKTPEKPKEEIKAATDDVKPESDKKDTEVKDENKLPVWGVVFLITLAGIGGYLFYSQSGVEAISKIRKK